MRYMNMLGTQVGNPRRRRRRNPQELLDVNEWFQGGKILKAASVGAGVVVTEGSADGLKGIGDYIPVQGQPLDFVKVAMNLATRGGIGIIGGALLEAAGQRAIGEHFALGGVAAAIMRLAADLGVGGGILTNTRSLTIGSHQLASQTPPNSGARAPMEAPAIYGL